MAFLKKEIKKVNQNINEKGSVITIFRYPQRCLPKRKDNIKSLKWQNQIEWSYNWEDHEDQAFGLSAAAKLLQADQLIHYLLCRNEYKRNDNR